MQKSKFLAALLCLIPSLGSAADIQYAPPISAPYITPYTWESIAELVPQRQSFDFSHLVHVRITGPIEAGDAQRLADLALDIHVKRWNADINQWLIVSFDSAGGNYQEGLALSDLIQTLNAATYVGPGDQCLSACALAWLGGREEVLRRILWQPTRFLHVDSELGFHAPFNNEYPQGIGSLSQDGVELVADLFYGLANESIREMQKRLSKWQIRPEFAFELLGKGRDEFLMVDHADPLFRNNFTALAEKSQILPQIGSLEATAVCNYVLRTSVEPAANYQEIGNFGGSGPDFSDPQQLRDFAGGTRSIIFETTSDGRDILIVEDLIPGRGPFKCFVENDLEAWVVHLSGDIPTVPTVMGNTLNINEGRAYFVFEHNALGLTTPWRVLKGNDLWLRSDPFADVPAEYLRDSGPSFDCGGDLDNAAEVICAFPTLSRADAIMAALYGAKRDMPGVKDAQQAWVQERNKACRVAHIGADQDSSFRIAGYCLLAFSLARIQTLSEI